MTKDEAIESFECSNKQAKLRLEVEKMRMDISEVKELKFYIERDEMAIQALEDQDLHPATPAYQKVYMQGWNDGRRDLIEKIKREFKI